MALNMELAKRPFAVEPLTGLMMPDGIFDTCIHNQLISCYISNKEGVALENVEIYFESVSDPGIVIQAKTHEFEEIPANASVLVQWAANFKQATPGKKLISVRAAARGKPVNRMLSKIFVSKTEYDFASRTLRCQVPQGLLEMKLRTVVGPKYKDENEHRIGPWLIAEFTCVLTSAQGGYKGVRGDLPFHDPWWKVIAAIIALIAGLGAVIAAAFGKGKASVSFTCDLDRYPRIGEMCKPDVKMPDKTIAGVLSSVAAGALTAALKDDEDVWYRGQEATKPGPNETTKSEVVTAKLVYSPDHPPVAGEPYPIELSWQYVRVTDKQRREHAVTETVTNTNTITGLEVVTPKSVKIGTNQFIIKAKCRDKAKMPYKGNDIYVLGLAQAPNNMTFSFPLKDDGIEPDEVAEDGWYTGQLGLGSAVETVMGTGGDPVGDWKVYVIVQNVNLAPLNLPPLEAAKRIGGIVLSSPFSLSLKPGNCPYAPSAIVRVVR